MLKRRQRGNSMQPSLIAYIMHRARIHTRRGISRILDLLPIIGIKRKRKRYANEMLMRIGFGHK